MCRFALWVGWRIFLRGKPSARCGQSFSENKNLPLQLREDTSCSRSHPACMSWKALSIKQQRAMRSLDRALLDHTVSTEHVGGAKVLYGVCMDSIDSTAGMYVCVHGSCCTVCGGVCIRATVALQWPSDVCVGASIA